MKTERMIWKTVLLIACGFIMRPGEVAATPPDLGEGLRIEVELPDQKECTWGRRSIATKVVVSSNIDEPIELTRVVTQSEAVRQLPLDKEGRLVKTLEIGEGKLSLATDLRGPEEIYPRSERVFAADLDAPAEDGTYKELVTIYWKYPNLNWEASVQKSVHYLVEDGCTEIVSGKEYELLTDPSSVEEYVTKNGEKMTVIMREGFDESSPYKGERLDEAEIVPADHEMAFAPAPAGREDRYSEIHESDGFERGSGTAKGVLNLSYCVRVQYRDNFVLPPTNTTGMKWWRPRSDGGLHNFQGLLVHIYDYDSSGGDDYITAGYLNFSSDTAYSCFNFQWDQSAQSETYPDPYVKTMYVVKDVEFSDSNKQYGHLCANGCTCSSRYVRSWRSSYTSDLGSGWYIYPTLTFGSSTSNANARAMQMHALQKFFRGWRSRYMTHDIKVDWQNEGIPASYGSSTTCIGLTKKFWWEDGDQWIDMYRRWDVAPHEAGHTYQKQMMGITSGDYESAHKMYCSYTDYTAMKEGWAEFVATRSWYPSSKSTSHPVYSTSLSTYEVEPGGYTFYAGKDPQDSACQDQCSSLNCDCYSRNETMALRAFWDIWDTHVDPSYDDADIEVYWQNIARIWTLYPTGSANGARGEYDTNMRDYHTNASSISSGTSSDVWTVFLHNQTSMACQDPN